MDSLASADGSNGDYIPPSIRHKYTQLTGTRSDHGIERHTALLPGAGNRVRRATRRHRRFHIQPRGGSALGINAATADQPAGLVRRSAGVAAMGVWRG